MTPNPELTNSEGTNIDTPEERAAWKAALLLGTAADADVGDFDAAGAAAAAQAYAIQRGNHTGTQAQGTIDGLVAALAALVPYTGATAGLNLGAFGLTAQLVATDLLYRSGDAVAVADLYYRQLTANQGGIPLVIAEWDGAVLETLGVTGFGIDPVSLPNGADIGDNVDMGGNNLTNVSLFDAVEIQGPAGTAAFFPYGADTLSGYGYTTSGGAAEFPQGIQLGATINASNCDIDFGGAFYGAGFAGGNSGAPVAANFPSGLALSGGFLDMGNYDIDNCYSIYSSSFMGGTSSSPAVASFPQGIQLGADLEAAGFNLSNAGTVSATNGSFATTFTGGITNVANNGPAIIYYGAQLYPTTVAGLTGTEGNISYVTDSLAPAVGATVAAGGAAKCLVCYNGTNWKVIALL